jgi:replicative DNA helicase
LGIITLNISEERFIARVLSNVSRVLLESILRGKLQEEDRQKLKYAINVDDFNRIELAAPGYMNIDELITICNTWVSEKNVQIIFIDYLHLISVNGMHDNDLKIFTISKALKKLSIDLHIPIIITVPITSNKSFTDLKDLRKIGAIETFADVIIFINSQVHNIDNTEKYNREIILSIQKNNTGLLDNMKVRAALHVQKFVQSDY